MSCEDRSGTIIPPTLSLTKTGPRSERRTGPQALAFWILALAVLSAGCQTAPPTYRVLTEQIAAGADVSVGDLRQAFLAAPDSAERMARLTDLELQAFSIIEDEPLKLGSIGTAIIDTYYGSLTGHYVLARFYRHVDNEAAALPHETWVERIQASMAEGASDRRGAGTQPMLVAVTPIEAQVYALSRDLDPIGSIYQTSEAVPFSLMLQATRAPGPVETLQFDLTSLLTGMQTALGGDPEDPDFTPLNLIGYLAKQGDSAAQTAVGAFLASQGRLDDAINWLRSASRTGNMLANTLLARIFWEQARQTEDEALRQQALDEVLENYLHAIALGSPDAMYALGVLYLNGHFGEDNLNSGVPLLNQAAALDHSDAIMFLAHLHYAGEVVERDLTAARTYYARAAELGNPYARRSYARFLLDRSTEQSGDPQALAWLEELAGEGDAEAMLLIGNLHARGLGTQQSARAAVNWFRKAVAAAPGDASIVNEVAWTLTVSDQTSLRRVRYARQIMDRLMTNDSAARARPEYLDTWAAIYAASGDFERAVSLQEEAIAAATAGDFGDVEEILRKHLEYFRSGQTISEAIP
ncbi:MAG: sel1 repeat family protein [Pseudomonadales bacterium]|nr:sel1 repeat family protein [Pseudomonadales bacterium]